MKIILKSSKIGQLVGLFALVSLPTLCFGVDVLSDNQMRFSVVSSSQVDLSEVEVVETCDQYRVTRFNSMVRVSSAQAQNCQPSSNVENPDAALGVGTGSLAEMIDPNDASTVTDFLALFGFDARIDHYNMASILAFDFNHYKLDLMKALMTMQRFNTESGLNASGDDPISRLEAIAASQIGYALYSKLLGGSTDNFWLLQGGEIDYVYDRVTPQFHIEAFGIKTDFARVTVKNGDTVILDR